jgi:CRP/FNR family transcriptional regulator, cyclic AMP receptor protein
MISPETEAAAMRGLWFGGLETELRQHLLERAEMRNYPAGEVVCEQGGPGNGVHLLVDGRLHLSRSLAGGRSLLVHVAQPGFWFGEPGFLTGDPNYLAAIPVANSRVLTIGAQHLLDAIMADPHWAKPIMTLWLSQVPVLLRMLEQTRRPGTVERVAARLSILAGLEQGSVGPIDSVLLNLTQAELGLLSDLSRQHTNRALRALEREGLVELGQSRIVIPNPTALAERANDGG